MEFIVPQDGADLWTDELRAAAILLAPPDADTVAILAYGKNKSYYFPAKITAAEVFRYLRPRTWRSMARLPGDPDRFIVPIPDYLRE